ncbi:DUF58 domain-containing protein [Microbacterium sp. Marseille-Q6965]|uniref:DUF58 domain-containing protein n=1 Tax=Microbacterium sp. Marseille-Q6965 TaxID=2965072 RepID=UPI0021B73528|nr:DUF58 domain-containing protein [Microbacterium sp. Marseille-Q6965]
MSRRGVLAPGVAAGAVGAVLLGATGLATARPDIALLGLPLVVTAAITVARPGPSGNPHVVVTDPVPAGEGEVSTVLCAGALGAEAVQVRTVLGSRVTRDLVLAPGERAEARSGARHSGPWFPVSLTARIVDLEGSDGGPAAEPVLVAHAIAPAEHQIAQLPLPDRLTGLHGAHAGRRPGQGGDPRDVHPYAPGDERRRIDWRATARLARRPGDLFVRRTDAMSDASVAIVVDGVDDLAGDALDWSQGEREGVTSLDIAREAARAIAAATVAQGDRVGLHELGRGGRTVRAGAGGRHLARVSAAIAGIAPRPAMARRVRMPPLPRGAIVYLLSTFLDGQAAQFAEAWASIGHRVIAIDTLPHTDATRLDARERVALRLLLAERTQTVAELRRAGIETLRWTDDGAASLRRLARRRS